MASRMCKLSTHGVTELYPSGIAFTPLDSVEEHDTHTMNIACFFLKRQKSVSSDQYGTVLRIRGITRTTAIDKTFHTGFDGATT